MPVVEPYAISTCMATAGKINLNDQIAPFTYLHRSTALACAARRSAHSGHSGFDRGQRLQIRRHAGIPSIWNAVDEDATVAQIENRFAAGSADAYLSESEICTVPLVPKGQAADTVAATQTALAYFLEFRRAAGCSPATICASCPTRSSTAA